MTQTPAPRARGVGPAIARQDWLLAIALAIFVGVLTWFGRSVVDFLAPSDQTVATPTFIGQTESDAMAQAERLHLRAAVITRTASDRYPKDVVMGQEPASGARVRPGRQISLIVSKGVEIFPMPDLRYESMREVNFDLSRFKLTLGKTKTVNNDDVPTDHVVMQNPPPLSSVRVGSAVDLELSSGPPPGVRAPNFERMDIDQARERAQHQHIQLGQIVWTPFGYYGPARGEVVRQRPAPGTRLAPLETVSLQVSAGPLESGYIIRQVRAVATVPASVDNARVRVEVRDDTGTRTVFNGYATGRQKFGFDLTVVGTAALDMYVNDALVSSTVLGTEPPKQEQQTKRAPPAGGVKGKNR
ncbi:MAG: PASTA domain-containing protein [Vulcanimicrobiaceae bacterium]